MTLTFLGLPREMRDSIYEHAIVTSDAENPICPQEHSLQKPNVQASILLVNCQINEEVRELFYRTNHFKYDITGTNAKAVLARMEQRHHERYMPWIQHMEVSCETQRPQNPLPEMSIFLHQLALTMNTPTLKTLRLRPMYGAFRRSTCATLASKVAMLSPSSHVEVVDDDVEGKLQVSRGNTEMPRFFSPQIQTFYYADNGALVCSGLRALRLAEALRRKFWEAGENWTWECIMDDPEVG